MFEDTIDGYFPLRESLHQMMNRKQFNKALIRICHAPAIETPELAPTDPVPLYIDECYGCTIHDMIIIVRRNKDTITISGIAQWTWENNHRINDTHFSDTHRLAEPAFVRGIALGPSDHVNEQHHLTASLNEQGSQNLCIQTALIDDTVLQGKIRITGNSLILEPTDPTGAKEAIYPVTISQNTSQQKLLYNLLYNR